MKTYKLPITNEVCDYLQRLSFEVESRKQVVTRILENAKDNADDSVLESIPFKSYHKQLEEAIYSYETAKNTFSKDIEKEVFEKEGKEIAFSWTIEDFHEPEVTIMIEG